MTYLELHDLCVSWMEKQDKLYLFWDYRDLLEEKSVRKFLDYCESEITNGNDFGPEGYLYNWLSDNNSWYIDYEQERFDETFYKKFIEEYPELENEEDLHQILREVMYECNKFDACLEHFNTTYNFYLLTDPEKTIGVNEYTGKIYPSKYFRSLRNSQGWSANSKGLRTILDGAYDYLGVCIHLNISLFDMVKLMKAKRLVVKKGTIVYLFNPFNGSGGVDTELTSDRGFNLRLNEIGFGVDGATQGPWGYTPNEVYGWVHNYFDNNHIHYKSF